MLGLGAVIGLPSIAYLIAFRKERAQRESFLSNPISLTRLAENVTSERERARLSATASRLLKKLEQKSDSESIRNAIVNYQRSIKSYPNTQSLSMLNDKKRHDERRFHSFSEFVSLS